MSKIQELDRLYLENRAGRSGIITDPMTVYSTIEDFSEVDNEGRTFLHLAVSNLDLDGVLFLFEKGVSPEKDNKGNHLFHALANSPYFAKESDIIAREKLIYAIAKILIENKVKYKRKNDYEHLAYVVAAEKLAYPILKALAEDGLKMDAPKENGMNLMHYLLEKAGYNKPSQEKELCLSRTIEALIESGLDPEDKDAFGYDVDTYARRADLRQVIAMLTGDESAAVNGGMSLVEALSKKEFNIADELLANGADINEVDSERLMTPLMWFCSNPRPDAVKYLVAKGADINFIEGSTNESAMSLLIKKGYDNLRGLYFDALFDIYKTLCKGGANLSAVVDGLGNTALNLLCQQRDMEGCNTKLAEILIDNDADVNRPNLEGLSPMMSFTRYNGRELQLGIIELLLDEDADVNQKDRYGNTVLLYATALQDDANAKKIAELVLEVNSELANVANNAGQAPMDVAIACNNEACSKVILMNM